MSVFLKTVELDNDPMPYIRIGQWVRDSKKGMGRVVANRNGRIYVSWLKGDKFKHYNNRFAKACWYQRGGDVGEKIKTAPLSLTIYQLKKRLGMI